MIECLRKIRINTIKFHILGIKNLINSNLSLNLTRRKQVLKINSTKVSYRLTAALINHLIYKSDMKQRLRLLVETNNSSSFYKTDLQGIIRNLKATPTKHLPLHLTSPESNSAPFKLEVKAEHNE